MVVENLRYMLQPYNSSDPLYFGCKFKPYVSQGYMSGGAGYVLSKEALKRFVTQGIGNNYSRVPNCGIYTFSFFQKKIKPYMPY